MKHDRMVLGLREWLLLYLLPEKLEFESWIHFWLGEADATAMVIFRVLGLTAYFQAEAGKITAGNAGDINHAGHALEVTHFFTADNAFHRVLMMVAQQPKIHIGLPILVPRAASNIVEAIRAESGW